MRREVIEQLRPQIDSISQFNLTDWVAEVPQIEDKKQDKLFFSEPLPQQAYEFIEDVFQTRQQLVRLVLDKIEELQNTLFKFEKHRHKMAVLNAGINLLCQTKGYSQIREFKQTEIEKFDSTAFCRYQNFNLFGVTDSHLINTKRYKPRYEDAANTSETALIVDTIEKFYIIYDQVKRCIELAIMREDIDFIKKVVTDEFGFTLIQKKFIYFATALYLAKTDENEEVIEILAKISVDDFNYFQLIKYCNEQRLVRPLHWLIHTNSIELSNTITNFPFIKFDLLKISVENNDLELITLLCEQQNLIKEKHSNLIFTSHSSDNNWLFALFDALSHFKNRDDEEFVTLLSGMIKTQVADEIISIIKGYHEDRHNMLAAIKKIGVTIIDSYLAAAKNNNLYLLNLVSETIQANELLACTVCREYKSMEELQHKSFELAYANDSTEVVKQLIKVKFVYDRLWQPLIEAGDIKKFNETLEYFSVDDSIHNQPHNEQLLNWAISAGKLRMVERLLEFNCINEIAATKKNEALALAVENRDVDLVIRLIKIPYVAHNLEFYETHEKINYRKLFELACEYSRMDLINILYDFLDSKGLSFEFNHLHLQATISNHYTISVISWLLQWENILHNADFVLHNANYALISILLKQPALPFFYISKSLAKTWVEKLIHKKDKNFNLVDIHSFIDEYSETKIPLPAVLNHREINYFSRPFLQTMRYYFDKTVDDKSITDTKRSLAEMIIRTGHRYISRSNIKEFISYCRAIYESDPDSVEAVEQHLSWARIDSYLREKSDCKEHYNVDDTLHTYFYRLSKKDYAVFASNPANLRAIIDNLIINAYELLLTSDVKKIFSIPDLLLAVKQGYVKIVAQLLTFSLESDDIKQNISKILTTALDFNQTEVVKILLDHECFLSSTVSEALARRLVGNLFFDNEQTKLNQFIHFHFEQNEEIEIRLSKLATHGTFVHHGRYFFHVLRLYFDKAIDETAVSDTWQVLAETIINYCHHYLSRAYLDEFIEYCRAVYENDPRIIDKANDLLAWAVIESPLLSKNHADNLGRLDEDELLYFFALSKHDYCHFASNTANLRGIIDLIIIECYKTLQAINPSFLRQLDWRVMNVLSTLQLIPNNLPRITGDEKEAEQSRPSIPRLGLSQLAIFNQVHYNQQDEEEKGLYRFYRPAN